MGRGAGAACQCDRASLGMWQAAALVAVAAQYSTAQHSTSLLTDGRPCYSIKLEAPADTNMPDGRCLEPKALDTQVTTHLCSPYSMVVNCSTACVCRLQVWPSVCRAAMARHSAGHILLAGLPEVC